MKEGIKVESLENELQNRIKKCQKQIKKQGYEAYVVSDPDDVWYLTNINYSPEQRPFLLIIFPEKEPVFIVPKLEETHVNVPYFSCEVHAYFDVTAKKGENWYEVLTEALSDVSIVGAEENLPMMVERKIKSVTWEIDTIVKEQRAVKSEYEIAQIQLTADASSKVCNATLQAAKVGSGVLDLYNLPYKVLDPKMLKETFSITNRLTNGVWPSDYSHMPHSIPASDAAVDGGPNINVAVFRIGGYASECERTFFTKEPTSIQRQHFEQMMGARKLMFSMIRPGVKACEIEEAVVNYFKEQGLDKYLLHRPGHGIGLNNHEEPTLSLGNETKLEENMVISVEPGIYFEGEGGYRHSDTVRVTKEGYELMTHAPDQLEDLIVGSF